MTVISDNRPRQVVKLRVIVLLLDYAKVCIIKGRNRRFFVLSCLGHDGESNHIFVVRFRIESDGEFDKSLFTNMPIRRNMFSPFTIKL